MKNAIEDFCFQIVIIVSYRDRAEHIYKLLAHLIPILKRQKLDFRFVLAEQNGTALFNKGRLYNTAYQYSRQFSPDCVVFHDVDVLPEDDRNSYSCTPLPSQLGGRVNTLNYE
jgi:hypothetical protein